jgi:hypothetical protein
MGQSLPVTGEGTRKSDGQILQIASSVELSQQKQERMPDRSVRRINGQRIYFRDLAIMAFPTKTDANLAYFAQVDARTARRWLAPDDKNEPPADVLGIVLAEIMRRYGKR